MYLQILALLILKNMDCFAECFLILVNDPSQLDLGYAFFFTRIKVTLYAFQCILSRLTHYSFSHYCNVNFDHLVKKISITSSIVFFFFYFFAFVANIEYVDLF